MLRDGSHLHRLYSLVFWHLLLQFLPLGMTKTSVVTVACSWDFSSYLLQEGSRWQVTWCLWVSVTGFVKFGQDLKLKYSLSLKCPSWRKEGRKKGWKKWRMDKLWAENHTVSGWGWVSDLKASGSFSLLMCFPALWFCLNDLFPFLIQLIAQPEPFNSCYILGTV